jgi:hypothetical protein
MSAKVNILLILAVLFVVPAMGCKSSRHQESSWAEMAANTKYSTQQSTPSYSPPVADEWVCPMHPSYKKSEPGKCSICHMDLVRSSELPEGGEPSSESGHSHSSGSGHSGSSGCGHCG